MASNTQFPSQRGPACYARLKAQMRSKQVEAMEEFEEHKRRQIRALWEWDRERRRKPEVPDVGDDNGGCKLFTVLTVNFCKPE